MLVILGACAGICYNALWYFPVLIVVGGIITVFWDIWLAQKVRKAKAKWESKRRRNGSEAGNAGDTSVAQEVQPAQQLQVRRPEAVKRRVQAGSSTDRILSGEEGLEPGPSDDQQSYGDAATTGSPPVTDVKSHNISIKLGVSLISGFFSKSSC
jgi:hypothetical protein